ncbi:hypothetical protein F5H01DRAFT_359535 [Linnemannia elongata]|nr:hypothetical protein F5H01DRAFT_359535 [Linnemannia elongata]
MARVLIKIGIESWEERSRRLDSSGYRSDKYECILYFLHDHAFLILSPSPPFVCLVSPCLFLSFLFSLSLFLSLSLSQSLSLSLHLSFLALHSFHRNKKKRKEEER